MGATSYLLLHSLTSAWRHLQRPKFSRPVPSPPQLSMLCHRCRVTQWIHVCSVGDWDPKTRPLGGECQTGARLITHSLAGSPVPGEPGGGGCGGLLLQVFEDASCTPRPAAPSPAQGQPPPRLLHGREQPSPSPFPSEGWNPVHPLALQERPGSAHTPAPLLPGVPSVYSGQSRTCIACGHTSSLDPASRGGHGGAVWGHLRVWRGLITTASPSLLSPEVRRVHSAQKDLEGGAFLGRVEPLEGSLSQRKRGTLQEAGLAGSR